MKEIILLSVLAIFMIGCNKKDQSKQKIAKSEVKNMYSTFADYETTPVSSKNNEDAADDPAIWIHPEDANKSTIIGSNKKAGIVVYNLKGEELYFYPTGNVNNVDVAYNFNLNGDTIDLVGGSNRTLQSITLHKIDPKTGELNTINKDTVKPSVDEVYGFCFYKNTETDQYYAIVNGKDGIVEQYEMVPTEDDKIKLALARNFQLESQIEGMVADYENQLLYVGEENMGVWQYGANPEDGAQRKFIPLTDSTNPNIEYDVEGITLYYAANQEGYLLISSQGNFTYSVYDRKTYDYLGSFKVEKKDFDGSEESDGIDVTNVAMGSVFPKGFFIAQDGFNYEGETLSTQNFKIIAWPKIAKLFPENLAIDTSFNIREFTR